MMAFGRVRAEPVTTVSTFPVFANHGFGIAPPGSDTTWKWLRRKHPSHPTGCQGVSLLLNGKVSVHLFMTQIHIKATLGSVSPHVGHLPIPTPHSYFLFNKLLFRWCIHKEPISTAETQFPASFSQNTLMLWIFPQDNTISHVQTLFLSFGCKGNKSLKIGLKSDTQESQGWNSWCAQFCLRSCFCEAPLVKHPHVGEMKSKRSHPTACLCVDAVTRRPRQGPEAAAQRRMSSALSTAAAGDPALSSGVGSTWWDV